MLKTSFIVVLLGVSVPSLAQPYTTSFGLRLGPLYGLSIKHYLDDQKSLEGIISFPWKGIVVNGLYAFNFEVTDWKATFFYVGFGGHLGIFNTVNPKNKYNNTSSGIILGVDGVLGVEHSFISYPIAMSLDFKPVLNLMNSNKANIGEYALSLRYKF